MLNFNNYSKDLYSICVICKNCNVEKGYCINTASSSAKNVLPINIYDCKKGYYHNSNHVEYKFECPLFSEDKRKSSKYLIRKTRRGH